MRRNILHLTLICVMALSASGQQRASAPGAAATSVERLRAHVEYLASDKLEGRRTGTAGAELAAAYIAREFKRLGLRRANQIARAQPESLDGYGQRFPFIAGVELGRNNRMLFTPGAQVSGAGGASSLDLRAGEDWMPQGFSPNANVENAPAVFVGYGITASELQYDDYAGGDAHGCVAVAFAGTPDGDNPHGQFARYSDVRWKAIAARDHGARALVVIASEDNFKDDRLAQLSYDNASGDAGLPVAAVSRQVAAQLLGLAGPVQLAALESDARKSATLKLQGTTASADPHTARSIETGYRQLKAALSISTDIRRAERPAANVIGMLEGSDPKLKDEAIIVGAHYDHLGYGGEGSLAPRPGQVHHGADDNASGTAGLIELARSFASRTQKPRRTLIFIAFSGEEEGLLGSNFYVNHPVWPLARTVAMLNMDMIGRMKDRTLLVGGVGTAREWRDLLDQSNTVRLNFDSLNERGARDERGFTMHPPITATPESMAARNNDTPIRPPRQLFKLMLNEDGYGPSDHSSFYSKQVPVLFFWTGTHQDYHKPSDTAEKINYADEADILSLVRNGLEWIDNLDQRPVYTVAKSESAGRSVGFRVYLGTIPNYAESGEGLRLDGVRDDSPAAAAGLRAGDLVVKLAGRDVKNVYDYTYALGEMKAGQEYEVEVVRGGERLKLKIIPAARK